MSALLVLPIIEYGRQINETEKREVQREARPSSASCWLHPLTPIGSLPFTSPGLVLLYLPDSLASDSCQNTDNGDTSRLWKACWFKLPEAAVSARRSLRNTLPNVTKPDLLAPTNKVHGDFNGTCFYKVKISYKYTLWSYHSGKYEYYSLLGHDAIYLDGKALKFLLCITTISIKYIFRRARLFCTVVRCNNKCLFNPRISNTHCLQFQPSLNMPIYVTLHAAPYATLNLCMMFGRLNF